MLTDKMRKISFLALIFFVACGFWRPSAAVTRQGVETRIVDAEGAGVVLNKRMPKILVLIAEQNRGEQYPSYCLGSPELTICESVMRSRFSEAGFTFVDHTALADKIDVKKLCGNEYAVSLGNGVDAELVIVGKAQTRCAGNVAGTTMKSFQASITARAIKTDNGVIIASASAHGTAIHMDDLAGGSEAIEKAAGQLASLLKSQIMAKWQKKSSSTIMVAMTVRGIKSCSDFVRFKEALKTQVKGIKYIYPRRMESGTIILDLDLQGNVQSLADELAVKKFSSFSLDITNISQNSIELKLRVCP